MGEIIKSAADCADCLCSNCDVFNEIVDTEEDCDIFLPDEDI